MESLLSLPRFAKAGLAVLLAVALLGWGIVAYSSKRQHEDANSLRQAIATLNDKAETEQTVATELDGLREQLATAQTEFAANLQEKNTLEDRVGDLESQLKQREEAVAALESQALEGQLTSTPSADSADGGANQALGLVGGSTSGTADVDVATLRERLTSTRTKLSARSATLSQRDRDLERARNDYELATAENEALEAALVEQGVLRERLSAIMTKLSSRSATLAQRDRQLERATADYETATARIETLEEALVEQGVLRERLSATMTKLSSRSATLAQRDRELERTKADYETATANIEALEEELAEQGVLRERLSTAMTKLSASRATVAQRDRSLAALGAEHEQAAGLLTVFEADSAKREETGQTLSSLALRVERTKEALEEGGHALSVNQTKIAESETRLSDLQTRYETTESAIKEKEEELAARGQDLIDLGEKIKTEEAKLLKLEATLAERENEIVEAKQRLDDLKTAESETEASISSLTAEIEQHQATLGNKEDAITYGETTLAKLKDEMTTTENRIAETEALLDQKVVQLNEREQDVRAVEATLGALKEDRKTAATETVELQKSISDQETVLADLAMAKDDLGKTRTELGYQKTILKERQEQIQLADARLDQLQQAIRNGSSRDQTFARIPIAAVSQDNLAVLPIDPLREPFPIQTPKGIRLTQVHFDMGSAQLTPGGLRKAKEAAAWIRNQDVEKIRLVGFTDSIGTKANNRALAKRRATSLLRVFKEEGVDPNRIEIIAQGEVDAGEVTADQTAEPLNRCVGVFIGADG